MALEDSIDTHVQGLLRLIREKYVSSLTSFKPMDFAQKAQFFTLDVISDIGFGEAFGDIVRDQDVHGYAKAAEYFLSSVQPVLFATGLVRLMEIEWIGKLAFPSDKDGVGIGKVVS